MGRGFSWCSKCNVSITGSNEGQAILCPDSLTFDRWPLQSNICFPRCLVLLLYDCWVIYAADAIPTPRHNIASDYKDISLRLLDFLIGAYNIFFFLCNFYSLLSNAQSSKLKRSICQHANILRPPTVMEHGKTLVWLSLVLTLCQRKGFHSFRLIFFNLTGKIR